MIRNATLDDLTALAVIGHAMFSESRYSRYNYNVSKVVGLVARLIQEDTGIVVVYEKDGQIVGGVMAELGEHYFGECIIAHDYALFVLPEHRGSTIGIRLLKEYVKQATELGAQEVVMANSTGVDVEMFGRLMKLAHFERVGGVYIHGVTTCAQD